MYIITAGGNIVICDCVYGKNNYALVALCLSKWGLERRLQSTAVFVIVECRYI